MNDCPEDFQSPNSRDILKRNILNLFHDGNRYIVYGNNLYTIMVYQWGKSKLGEENVKVITGDALSGSLYNTFCDFCDGNVNKEFDENDSGAVLLNTNKNESVANCVEFKEIIQLSRYSEKIAEYRNNRIEKFKNKHNGQKCFIIGLGPSLRVEDLDYLNEKNKYVLV